MCLLQWWSRQEASSQGTTFLTSKSPCLFALPVRSTDPVVVQDKKYGMGGPKRYKKNNSSESSANMTGFQLSSNNAPFKTVSKLVLLLVFFALLCPLIFPLVPPQHKKGGARKAPQRPGKERRQKMRTGGK